MIDVGEPYLGQRSAGRPLFPKEIYEDWLARNLGTPEQQERYRAAVRWYEGRQDGEEKLL